MLILARAARLDTKGARRLADDVFVIGEIGSKDGLARISARLRQST